MNYVVGISVQRLRNLMSPSVSDLDLDSRDTITLTSAEMTT